MKILLNHDVAIKLKYYAKFANGEISGIGKSIITEEGDTIITDIMLVEQECTSSTTELSDVETANLQTTLDAAGEDMKLWNVWWHTHGHHGVFWSSKDDDTISKHSNDFTHLVSIVTNKKNEFKGRIDVFPKDLSPYKKGFSNSQYDCDVEIVIDKDKKETSEINIKALSDMYESRKAELEELELMMAEEEDKLMENELMKEQCQIEVEDKVTEKVYKHKPYNKSQSQFENILDNIKFAIPENEEYSNKKYESEIEDVYNNYNEDTVCNICGKTEMFCECDDLDFYYDEMGKKVYFDPNDEGINLNKYLSNAYRGY